MSHTFVLLSILLCCSIGINHYKLRNCHAAFQSTIGINCTQNKCTNDKLQFPKSSDIEIIRSYF